MRSTPEGERLVTIPPWVATISDILTENPNGRPFKRLSNAEENHARQQRGRRVSVSARACRPGHCWGAETSRCGNRHARRLAEKPPGAAAVHRPGRRGLCRPGADSPGYPRQTDRLA